MAQKALIAMSGGVDSSVAALLMRMKGYECIGATMKLYHNEDIGLHRGHTCCSLEDVEDARSVAYRLGMLHYVFNFSEHFRQKVMEPFVRAYETGQTPNPCIDCNRYLKFDVLHRRARELHCDYVVTGHYARVEYDENREKFLLKKAISATKDQSYVLYSMTQEELAHTLFPLGGMEKSEARRIAEENGLITARKHDSQDICFVPDGDYAAFIERFTGQAYPEGDFLDEQGRILGRHRGIIRYTVGQRKGLGLSFPEPMYVKAIDPARNAVVLAPERSLYRAELTARDVNLIALDAIERPMRVQAKVRYSQKARWATAEQRGEKLYLRFDEPQRAITKGQAVVLYDGEIVVGGGTIE